MYVRTPTAIHYRLSDRNLQKKWSSPAMAASLKRVSILPMTNRAVVSLRKFYDAKNRISAAYNPNITRDGPSPATTGGPAFMTRSTFEQNRKLQRTVDVGPDYGIRPTRWQRYFLVVTKLYQTSGDIPLYVSAATMNRMHDRMRILITSLGICGFFILFYYCHYANFKRVIRDRNRGFIMRS
ncbi:hypothetical protein Y032_0005g2269 [Ancylostoma ceylanicum]|nr:hypothetical protein Y032_0005g2269 [Ancylostoma ceylanicum]